MGYIDENLMAGEHVVHRTKLHWIAFSLPIALALTGLVWVAFDWRVTGFFLGLAAVVAFPVAIRYATSEFGCTNRRVILKIGWVSRTTVEMLLSKVENIGVIQGIVGRLLDYGTIRVTGTGGTDETFTMIAGPLAFRRAVQEQTGRGGDDLPRAAAAVAMDRDERECPFCAERILARARVCKHCGRDLEPRAP